MNTLFNKPLEPLAFLPRALGSLGQPDIALENVAQDVLLIAVIVIFCLNTVADETLIERRSLVGQEVAFAGHDECRRKSRSDVLVHPEEMVFLVGAFVGHEIGHQECAEVAFLAFLLVVNAAV